MPNPYIKSSVNASWGAIYTNYYRLEWEDTTFGTFQVDIPEQFGTPEGVDLVEALRVIHNALDGAGITNTVTKAQRDFDPVYTPVDFT
jgi:hypothetical protein